MSTRCSQENSILIRTTYKGEDESVLSIPEKAQTGVKGIRYRSANNAFEGHIYTVGSLRLKTAFYKSLPPSLLTIFAFALPFADQTDALPGFIFSLWAFFYLYYSGIDPGVRFKITPEHFIVGMRRFDLHQVGNVHTERKSYSLGVFDEIICFRYGRGEKKIHIRNAPRNAFAVAEELNALVIAAKRLKQETAKPAANEALARSANF